MRPLRVFLSGNCQIQFVYDALRALYRGEPDIAFVFRASYRAVRQGEDEAARQCDVHVAQVTNLAIDPWAERVPASARRIRVPALILPGVFHAFAPAVHPEAKQRGRPPFYLARGNRVLNGFVARHRGGEPVERLVAEYRRYRGAEIESAPRLFELNCESMRRLGRLGDFDPWSMIEPHLRERRFFWSVKHPTLETGMMLVRGVLEILGVPWDEAALAAMARGSEYHEPYHAPIHPRLAERLGLAWAGAATRYRFFHTYFTAAEHARRYIAGDFESEFALNEAIRDARRGGDAPALLDAFRAQRARFPANGQADLWYGRALQRRGNNALAAYYLGRALSRARSAPHAVPHRADIRVERIEVWLRRCQRDRSALPSRGPTEDRLLLAPFGAA